MRSKTMLVSVALAGVLSWSAAFASVESADGAASTGYSGWGPMANLETPYSPNETAAARYDLEIQARAQHVAEVEEARERMSVANAHLRAQSETQAVAAPPMPNLLFAPFRSLARLINPKDPRYQAQ